MIENTSINRIQKVKRIFSLILMSILFLLIFSFFSIVVLAYFESKYFDEHAKGVELALGFRTGDPYTKIGDDTIEVLTFIEIETNSILDKAGVKRNDILLKKSILNITTNWFSNFLFQNQGNQIEFFVVPGGNGPTLDERPKREIRILVPNLKDIKK
jgi:hypothetical protein